MFDLVILVKIFLVTWFVTRFEPIQKPLVTIDAAVNDYLTFKKRPFYEIIFFAIINSIIKILTCSKCFSFWFGLVFSNDFYTAALSSLIMVIFEKSIGDWLSRVKLN